MARIAYILLCHKDPEGVIAQAGRLTAAGDFIAIHFDARAPREDFERIRRALRDNPDVVFARRRIRCGWGAWSLVAATLSALETAAEAFPRATHFYMLSGDCMAIKSADYARAMLDRSPADYIESFDFHGSDWIRTGLREERLIYRHWFNERQHKAWFYRSLAWQKRLGLRRRPPEDLQIMIGSQWWCLRRGTAEAVLAFARSRPDVIRFFRTTWIPDETFFQTLVRHLVPAEQIRSRSLTFLMFSDYGMPVTFHEDHYDLLLAQDYLFARKLSPDATGLKARLGTLYAAGGQGFAVPGGGQRLYDFLAGRGRLGRRSAPRAWDPEEESAPEVTLLVVLCRKWHIGKRLVARARAQCGLPGVGYLFHDDGCELPDLGGAERPREKRLRHSRELLRLLSQSLGGDRLLICLDPEAMERLAELCPGQGALRVLEIDCAFSDADLAGHAQRLGLTGPGSPAGLTEQLLPVLRRDLQAEARRLRRAGFAEVSTIRQSDPDAVNLLPLARFLGISETEAAEILGDGSLFMD